MEAVTELKEYQAELAMQSKCFQWHWNSFPLERKRLYHINGKAKNAIEGAKFKAIGVVRGIADLGYICLINNVCSTIYIEMKTPIGVQSKEQKEFQAVIQAMGGVYLICKTFENFQEIIKKYQK